MQTQPQQKPEAIASALSAAFSACPPPVYSTVAQFAKRNPAFSEPAIRNLVFKAAARKSSNGTIPGNGLIESGAIVRLGRKVLINEFRFFEWLEKQGAV
jgi:hypothetical protein